MPEPQPKTADRAKIEEIFSILKGGGASGPGIISRLSDIESRIKSEQESIESSLRSIKEMVQKNERGLSRIEGEILIIKQRSVDRRLDSSSRMKTMTKYVLVFVLLGGSFAGGRVSNESVGGLVNNVFDLLIGDVNDNQQEKTNED